MQMMTKIWRLLMKHLLSGFYIYQVPVTFRSQNKPDDICQVHSHQAYLQLEGACPRDRGHRQSGCTFHSSPDSFSAATPNPSALHPEYPEYHWLRDGHLHCTGRRKPMDFAGKQTTADKWHWPML